MHARERAANARANGLHGKPAWLITAGVMLGGAFAYLGLTLADLQDQRPGPLIESVSEPAPVGAAAVSAADEAAPTPVLQQSEPPSQVSGPIPGLTAAVGDPGLLETIEAAVADDAGRIAIAVKRVSDGRAAAFNGDYRFYAASTYKLAVLYEAELRHFHGDLTYDDKIFISEEDAAEDLGTSGYLEFEEDGSITIQHLLEAMIEVSDNSSAVALLHEFGSGNIDATLRSLGLEAMTLSKVELWTTAADLGRLMEAIYVGEGVGPEERAHMRELLLGQTIRAGIPAALEDQLAAGVPVGNKTGTWPGAQHDVAFVEAQEGAYVIAVLTDGSYEGWLALHRVVQEVHQKLAESP